MGGERLLGGTKGTVGVDEARASLHIEVQVWLRLDVGEPLLSRLGWEDTHLDVSKLAGLVLALGTVAVEGGARLRPDCELGQGHEADATLWVRWVIALDVANIFSSIASLLPLVWVGDAGAIRVRGWASSVFGGLALDINGRCHLPHFLHCSLGSECILGAFPCTSQE